MAIKHTTPSDGTFSGSGATAWDADHNLEAETVSTGHLGGDISAYSRDLLLQSTSALVRLYVGAGTSDFSGAYADLTGKPDLTVYQLSSQISSAAFRAESYFAAAATLSSAAYALSTDFVASSVISTAAYRASSFFAQTATLSTAAYSLSTDFVASSVISTAAYRTSSFFVQTSMASSGAFQVSSMYAVSTHRLSHITGGADEITTFNATSSGMVPASGGGTANFLRADATWAAPSGGSDPWTYLKVSSQHYGTSSNAFSDIPGLSFIPGTNSTYEVEWHLMMKTSTAANTPRIGVRWPTGTTSVGWINQGQTNSTQLFTWGNQISTMQVPAAGLLATTTAPWGAIGGALINAFGGAASSFSLQHATESSTIFVSTMIGSYLKYRAI